MESEECRGQESTAADAAVQAVLGQAAAEILKQADLIDAEPEGTPVGATKAEGLSHIEDTRMSTEESLSTPVESLQEDASMGTE